MPGTDDRVNRTIAVLLRAGVLTAASVVMVSAIWYHSQVMPSATGYQVFHGEPAELCSPTQTLHAALHGDPTAWMQLGLLILIATPLARVAFSVAAFATEHDWTYVAVTLIVLAVLLYGLW
jgi:uncharacterized membrane protein